ncbi:hypothetical protein BGZ68_007220 [Mortierella alpina]|nr:hypothetical protein BGZ68_007220 [Mortierella alpina]
MKLCLSSIARSALILALTAQFAHSSESNTRYRDPLLEPSQVTAHEVVTANMAQPPAQNKGVSKAVVKDNNDHLFHMDILDIDEYEDEEDGALDEGDYNYDDDDDDGDYDDENEENRVNAVDLELNGNIVASEGKAESAPENNGDSSRPGHADSTVRGFHYADPLMVPPTDKEQCHIKHKRDETHSEPTSIAQEPSQSAAPGSDKEGQLTALANFEPGGACIDSFVNFALRFRERCNIFCLKTLTHLFAKPDVLGLVNCFGCINFLISGISAVITDCVGLFTPYPKPSTTATNPVPTGTVRKMDLNAQGDLYGATAVHADDQGQGTLDFKQVINSLQNIDMDQVQDWLDVGKKIVESTAPTAKNQNVETKSTDTYNPDQEGRRDKDTHEEKELFNNFIIKAASFANVMSL